MAKKDVHKIILGLLTKLGREYSAEITQERAQSKLLKALEDGVPEGVSFTNDEVNALNSIGVEVEFEEPKEEKGKKGKKAEEEKPKSKKEEPVKKSKKAEKEVKEEKPKKEKKAEKPAKAEKVKKSKKAEKAEKAEKPAKEKKAEKKEPKEKKPKVSRLSCICTVIKNLPKKGKTVDEISEQANAALVKAGGKDNLSQTSYNFRCIIPVLECLEIIKREGGKIIPAGE